MMQQSMNATQGTTEAQSVLNAAGEPSVSDLLKKAGLSQHLQAFQVISMENFKTLLMQASFLMQAGLSLTGMHQQLLDRQQDSLAGAGPAAMLAILIALHQSPIHTSTWSAVHATCFRGTLHVRKNKSWPWQNFLLDGSLKFCFLSAGLWQVWGDKYGQQAEAVPPDQAGELPGEACCWCRLNSLAASGSFVFAAKAQVKHSSMLELV